MPSVAVATTSVAKGPCRKAPAPGELELNQSHCWLVGCAHRDRGWKPYSQEQSAQIEQAFVARDGSGEHVLEGGGYAIDFSHMRQVNTTDRRRSRAVRRLDKRDPS